MAAEQPEGAGEELPHASFQLSDDEDEYVLDDLYTGEAGAVIERYDKCIATATAIKTTLSTTNEINDSSESLYEGLEHELSGVELKHKAIIRHVTDTFRASIAEKHTECEKLMSELRVLYSTTKTHQDKKLKAEKYEEDKQKEIDLKTHEEKRQRMLAQIQIDKAYQHIEILDNEAAGVAESLGDFEPTKFVDPAIIVYNTAKSAEAQQGYARMAEIRETSLRIYDDFHCGTLQGFKKEQLKTITTLISNTGLYMRNIAAYLRHNRDPIMPSIGMPKTPTKKSGSG